MPATTMQLSNCLLLCFGSKQIRLKKRNKLLLDGARLRSLARADLEGEQLPVLDGAGPQLPACAELEVRAAVGARRRRGTDAAVEYGRGSESLRP
jgi:hypothetical protein